MQTPQILSNVLNEKEEIEFIEQPLKSAYDRSLYFYLIASAAWLIGINGYFFTYGSFFEKDIFPSLFAILFLNFPLIMGIFSIVRILKRYPRSFYAYSNMRVFYTNPTSVKEMDFVYFKDIHDLKVGNQKLLIDVNDYQRYSKRKIFIIGVRNPEAFRSTLNERLQRFRDPNL
jgi:hypothetical protein